MMLILKSQLQFSLLEVLQQLQQQLFATLMVRLFQLEILKEPLLVLQVFLIFACMKMIVQILVRVEEIALIKDAFVMMAIKELTVLNNNELFEVFILVLWIKFLILNIFFF